MFKEVFIIGLLGHVIGDYYLQTENMSTNKKMMFYDSKCRNIYIKHILIYSLVQIFLFKVLLGIDISLISIICLSHAAIDILKIYLEKKYSDIIDESIFYLLDQLFHIIVLFIFSIFVVKMNIDTVVNYYIKEILEIINLENYNMINLCIISIILHKPVNVTCKIILGKYKMYLSNQNSKDKYQSNLIKAGALIGTLERLIIAIMLYKGDYSAIGLIFAAKSVARYDKISKDKEFAEYYLLGSLLSVLSALVVYGLVM